MQNYKDLEIYQFAPKAQSAKRKAQSAKAITLIEMVAIIAVVGLAIPPLMLMWQDLSYRSARATAISQATFYAQELMEEIKSKDFVDPDDPTNPALGPNGETYPNFDDVDDFNGYSENPISDAPGYNRCVTVDYADLSESTWAGNCSPPNPADCNPPTCNPEDATDYKRIRVLVSHRFGDSSLVTIVSGF